MFNRATPKTTNRPTNRNPPRKLKSLFVVRAYPESPKKGDPINIDLKESNSTQVFHSGTSISKEGKLITAGGRVLSITSQDKSFENAFKHAYEALNKVNFNGMQYRKDIGYQVRRVKNFSNKSI